MRGDDETENEFENRLEGAEDEEPGNPKATKKRTVPSTKVATKPKTPFPVSRAGGRAMPKGKFTNKHPGSKVVKSKAKNRSGKKYKRNTKAAPKVAQKMRSFGGQDFPI